MAEITSEQDALQLVTIAYKSGCPKDQLETFLTKGYVPLPWQWNFHAAARLADTENGPTKIGVGGARGPGKSHAVFSQMTLDDCARIPNLKGLFIRQTGSSAQESLEDLIGKVLRGKVEYEYTRNVLKFPNGSRILLGGFQDERDIDKYIGIEYDIIGIEELNQLQEVRVNKLLGSMRTSKENWRPRLYASFNPGGLGHLFVKNLFIEPFRNKAETRTRFIPSTYRDNPYLNKEYIEYLEELAGDLGKAWRDGDWDLFEGQYFGEWRYDKHVVEPFTIPLAWRRFGALDFGSTNPFCFKWYALDFDGNVWVYREYYAKGNNAEQNTKEVVRLNNNEQLDYVVADNSIFSKTGFAETIAEILRKNGIGKTGSSMPLLIPCSKDRIAGWQILRQFLFWDEVSMPRIRYFSTCVDSIRTIPSLTHDEHRPEDVETKGEDHAADTDRYFLQTLRSKKTAPPLSHTEKKILDFKKNKSGLDSFSFNIYNNI